MTKDRMHADEVQISPSLVQHLIRTQFPQWAVLPVSAVASSGTDNVIFRLGDSMAVRLPRRLAAVAQVEKEQAWLPRLAPALPLAVPQPIAAGTSADDYPWRWSVHSWLDGDPADIATMGVSIEAATALASFVRALQAVDSSGGPEPGPHNSNRGAPLAWRDARVREALAECDGLVDLTAVTAVWERALRAPIWTSEPVWLHGDLLPSNLLTKGGRLHAVIDFGMMGIGDPACDLLPAWAIFDGTARRKFRDVLGVEDATWERGKGWALSWAVIALPYYLTTNKRMVEMATHSLQALLIDG